MSASKKTYNEDFVEEDYFNEQDEGKEEKNQSEGASEPDPLDMFMKDMQTQEKMAKKGEKAKRVDFEDTEDPLDAYLSAIKQKEARKPKRLLKNRNRWDFG